MQTNQEVKVFSNNTVYNHCLLKWPSRLIVYFPFVDDFWDSPALEHQKVFPSFLKGWNPFIYKYSSQYFKSNEGSI